MKKSIIMGTIIFLCIIALAIIAAILVTDKIISKENSNMLVDIYNQYPTDVDEGIKQFMSSEEYNKMNKTKKIDTMGDLLNLYEQHSIIKNIHYDKPGQMYSFTYNYGDIKGALGGVMLKTWNPMMN